MAALTEDPLYLKQTDLASRLLGLYDPDAEEQRRQKALGQMQDVIGSRYARAGETGSSVEKDARSTAAKDFSLGWAERQPAQYSAAISGSQLPISNLLAGGNQDLLAGGLTGYYGGQPTLARQTANENFNLNQEKLQWLKDQATQDLWGGLAGSVGKASGLLDWLFPGQGTGYGGGGTGPGMNLSGAPSLVNWLTNSTSLPGAIGNAWDWITGAGSGIGSSVGVGSTLPSGALSTSAPDILSGAYDWLPLAGSPGVAGAGAAGGVNWTPELVNALYGGAEAGAGAAGSAGAGGGAMSGLAAGGPATAAIAALAYLLSPQMSPIPAMRDRSDQDIARLAQQDAQQYMTRSPAQLEELVQAAANGDPGVNGRAIEMLPSPRYDSFKARIQAAFAHTGEFAGHPSVSYPTQADQRVQEAISSMAASTGTVLTPEQYAWMYQPDTGR